VQGKVYRARDTVSGDVVALKLLDRVALGASGRAVHNLQRELEALRRLQGHAHIVKLLAVDYNVEVPRKRRPGSRSCVMLVLELAPRGEVRGPSASNAR
jgi:serine/threonine protein kinase